MAVFKKALDTFLRNKVESYHKFKKENGGSKYGLTYNFLCLKESGISVETIQNLTLATAVDMYFQHFWLDANFYSLFSQKIANTLFSTSIELLPKMAIRNLQGSVNSLMGKDILKEDGILGKKSINIINNLSENIILEKTIIDIYKQVIKNYKEFVRKSRR